MSRKFKTCSVHQIALKLLWGRKKQQDIFETEACCPRKMQQKGPFVQHFQEFGCKKTLIKFKSANSAATNLIWDQQKDVYTQGILIGNLWISRARLMEQLSMKYFLHHFRKFSSWFSVLRSDLLSKNWSDARYTLTKVTWSPSGLSKRFLAVLACQQEKLCSTLLANNSPSYFHFIFHLYN